jgi:hypothetical protein
VISDSYHAILIFRLSLVVGFGLYNPLAMTMIDLYPLIGMVEHRRRKIS